MPIRDPLAVTKFVAGADAGVSSIRSTSNADPGYLSLLSGWGLTNLPATATLPLTAPAKISSVMFSFVPVYHPSYAPEHWRPDGPGTEDIEPFEGA